MTEFVEHNLIVDGEIGKREYQDYLVGKGLEDSTLIVLPTGTGKTIVTLRITAERLIDNYGGTSLLLAPTKPLVEQHYETYSDLLDITDENIVKFTGDISPNERESIWEDTPSVVIATPQVIENDLIASRISLEDVIHLTFDECHRATGEYSYVYIADKYINQANDPLITGLSASPGDTKEDILQICKNINVNAIEIVSEDDPMIEDYLHETDIETRFIDISDEVLEVRDILQEVYKDRLEELYEDDFVDSRSKTLSQGKLRRARNKIQQEMQKNNDDAYKAMSIWAEAMKINRAIELIETQGVQSFLDYYSRLESELRGEDSSKAVERLVSDTKVQKAVQIARDFDDKYKKFSVLRSELVNTVKINGGKALVFTKSRDTVEALVDELSDDFSVGRLVGQSDTENSDGMTQKEQKESVNRFSRGEVEVLISTQIGEEGLDISEVNLVVFYEPATKGIEQIQRQGRTGRSQKGRVVMLIGNDTRDVGMYYKSKNNVEQMKSGVEELQEIRDLQDEIQDELSEETEQATLDQSVMKTEEDINEKINESISEDETESTESNVEIKEDQSKLSIVADSRETNSSVVRTLDMDDDVDIRVQNNMEVGDYIVGEECAVERKSIQDIHDTITGDRSLFEQIKNMSNSYDRSVLLVEGEHNKLYKKNIHPNAIRSIFASVICDFNTYILYSDNEEDTAIKLKYLAKKLQDDEETVVNPHGNKETGSVPDQLEYIVSSFDGIGPKTAKKLLEHFGDVHSIMTASVDDLQQVSGIGDKSANEIYSLVRTEYDP